MSFYDVRDGAIVVIRRVNMDRAHALTRSRRASSQSPKGGYKQEAQIGRFLPLASTAARRRPLFLYFFLIFNDQSMLTSLEHGEERAKRVKIGGSANVIEKSVGGSTRARARSETEASFVGGAGEKNGGRQGPPPSGKVSWPCDARRLSPHSNIKRKRVSDGFFLVYSARTRSLSATAFIRLQKKIFKLSEMRFLALSIL